MLVIRGTQARRRTLGRVADDCPVCHGPRPFHLLRVGAAGHLYGLSIGSGRLVGHERVCEDCRTPSETAIERDVAVSRDPALDLETLTRETHPDLDERSAERRALEERVREGTAGETERRGVLLEAFMLVNPLVEEQQRRNRLGRAGRRAALVMLAFFVAVTVVMGLAQARPSLEPLGAALSIGLALSFLVFLAFWATSMRRFVRDEVEPRLTRYLEPFEPTLEELRALVTHLRDCGLASGRRLDPRRLRRAVVGIGPTPRRSRAA